MTISPQEAERLADGLRTTFSNLEGILLERIARRLGSGTASPSWRDDKLAQVQAMKNEISELVEQFTKGMDGYIEKTIRAAYEMGKNGADMDVIKAQREGYDGQAVRNLQLLTSTSATIAPLNTLAISALVAEATGAIDGMKFNILRKSEDAYRQIISRTATSVLAGAETKLQAVQRSINEFADAGITGFVDKAGRNWNIGSYSDMAVRTAVGRAAMAGHELRLGDLEHDLVIVSQHPDECPLCRPFEGKIFSLKGTSEKYPPLAVAKAGGLFHCNCGHVATAYFEGFTSPMPEKIGKPTDYEEKQKQRAIERQIRKWKNREAVAITPQERQRAEAKRKEWQLAMREFIKDSGRRRKPERELINFGAKPNPSAFKTIPLKTEVKKPEKQKKLTKPKKEAKPKAQKQEPPKPPQKSAEERQRETDVAEFKKRIAESDVIERVGGKAYVDELARKFGEADEESRKLFLTWYSSNYIYNNGNGESPKNKGKSFWTPNDEKIYMTYGVDATPKDYKDIGATFFHEVGHLIDRMSFMAYYKNGAVNFDSSKLKYLLDAESSNQHSSADLILKTIKKESDELVKKIHDKYMSDNENKQFFEIEWKNHKTLMAQYGENLNDDKDKKKFLADWLKSEMVEYKYSKYKVATSDILSATYKNKKQVRFTHQTVYWNRNKYMVLSEVFAHVFEAEFSKETKAKFLEDYPETYELVIKIMRGLI